MKKTIILASLLILAVFAFAHYSQSKMKPYYSGDAISFNNEVYVATANTNSLEIFKLENNELKQIIKARPFDGLYNRYGNYYDAKLVEENGRLFVYTISDFTLYKYEVVDDSRLSLVFSQKNTYWEWYNRVDKFGDNIVTISTKGVKIWNKDLEVIDSYPFTNEGTPYNLRAYNNNNILDIQNNHLKIFNRESRQELSIDIPLNYNNVKGNRQAYQDLDGNLYVVDDYYAKKFNQNGTLIGSFKHADYEGYDMSASGDNKFIYFTDGAGIVKLDKNTMKETDSRWTTRLGGVQGWAMGLDVVSANGDKVVVFNNSNILILDSNLKKIASYQANEEEDNSRTENLFLRLNNSFGAPYAKITLTGGGYFPNELLNIDFGGTKAKAQADSRGRFTQELTVPDLKPGSTDIKVDGADSKATYSISFRIQ